MSTVSKLRAAAAAATLASGLLVAGEALASITASPGQVTVPQKQTSDVITVTIVMSGQFNPGAGNLVIAGLPSGVVTLPSPVPFPAPPIRSLTTSTTFRLQASPTAAVGTYGLTITTSPDYGAGTGALSLTVTPGVDIDVSFAKPSLDVCGGGPAVASSFTLTPVNGYAGTPNLGFDPVPQGLTVTPVTPSAAPMPPAQTIPFTVAAASGTTGPLTVPLNVLDLLNGVNKTLNLTVNITPPDFTPSVGAATGKAEIGGGTASVPVTVSPAGACPGPASVTIAPSGVPQGVTVTPASATLDGPSYGTKTFTVAAAAGAPLGSFKLKFTFTPSNGSPKTAEAQVEVTQCSAPQAPASPSIAPSGNPNGPVTATDYLALSWGAPSTGAAPSRYEWRINGEAAASVASPGATAPPRGKLDPIQLFVKAFACNPETGPGPESQSPVYSPAPPVADFSAPASAAVNQTFTLTDTSSPQATSWLWFYDDAPAPGTTQSQTHAYSKAGPHVVALVATNGSGTSVKLKTINVTATAPSSRRAASVSRRFDEASPGRLRLEGVVLSSARSVELLLLPEVFEGETVVFLRFLDAAGELQAERRLVLAPGEEAVYDLGAYGLRGAFTLELVPDRGIGAVLVERAAARVRDPWPDGTP